MKLYWPQLILGLLLLFSIEVCGQLSINYTYGLITSAENDQSLIRNRYFTFSKTRPSFDVNYSFENLDLGISVFSFLHYWDLPELESEWDNSVEHIRINSIIFTMNYRIKVKEKFSIAPSVGLIPYHLINEFRVGYLPWFSHCCNSINTIDKRDWRYSVGVILQYKAFDVMLLKVKYAYVRALPRTYEGINYDHYSILQFSYGVLF